MSVSRDFIDSYSPRSPELHAGRNRPPSGTPPVFSTLCGAHDGQKKLAFRFQTAEDLLQLPITVAQAGYLVLGLAQKSLQRLMQPDRLVDLGAGTRPIGPEPDQFLHISVGRHHLPPPRDGRQERR